MQQSINRRTVLKSSAGIGVALAVEGSEAAVLNAGASASSVPFVMTQFNINGRNVTLEVDARVTLLDALREHLDMPGTKKGCDHGQCGACTTIVNGRRIYSCLTLLAMHAGDEIRTIEGLATGEALHPMQSAFLERDGFQCGYCTPGQICSAVAMLEEIDAGIPSHATENLGDVAFSDAEVRERMSGNLCRCCAYPNIVEAIRDVHAERTP